MNHDELLDEYLVEAFARELQHQFDMATVAFRSLAVVDQTGNSHADAYWYHVESLVKSLMSMTNVLWSNNSRNPYKRRSRLLRQRFNLESFELPSDLRATRHGLEHFDERLDDWWLNDKRHNLADRNIGPKNMIAGLDSTSFARNYDPKSGELSVFGASFNLVNTYRFMERVLVAVTLSSSARSGDQ